METVLDAFSGDAFGVVSMTESINLLPYAPGRLGKLGIYRFKLPPRERVNRFAITPGPRVDYGVIPHAVASFTIKCLVWPLPLVPVDVI